jgi:hypothetical protein
MSKKRKREDVVDSNDRPKKRERTETPTARRLPDNGDHHVLEFFGHDVRLCVAPIDNEEKITNNVVLCHIGDVYKVCGIGAQPSIITRRFPENSIFRVTAPKLTFQSKANVSLYAPEDVIVQILEHYGKRASHKERCAEVLEEIGMLFYTVSSDDDE